MADLGAKDTSTIVGIVGLDSNTGETNPVNANASGELLTASSQAGTWNINNVSGTVSLPTGAATEATLALIKLKTDNLDVALSTRTKPEDLQKTNPQRDYFTSVQRGLIPGHVNVSFAGYNAGLGTSKEIVWAFSEAYVWKSSAAVLTVASSSLLDDASQGTGARALLIQGLNASYLEIEEIISLTGLLSVSTTLSYLRVNTIKVVAAGSSGTNVGNITAIHTGSVINYVLAGEGLSQSTFYTVPAACQGFIYSGYLRCSKTNVSGDLYVAINGVKYKVLKFDIASSDYSLNIRVPYSVPQKTDVWVEAAGTGGVTAVSAFVEMIKIQDGT